MAINLSKKFGPHIFMKIENPNSQVEIGIKRS